MAAGAPWLIRFGIYRGGAAERGSGSERLVIANLLCQGTPVGSKASQTVLPNEPFGVDGGPPGETVSLHVTHYRATDGKVGVDIDSASKE